MTFDFSKYSLQDGITQSLITTCLSCRKAFLYSINKVEKTSTITKVNFGNMFHEILGFFYNKKPLNLVADKSLDSIELLTGKIIDDYRTENAEQLQIFNPREFEIEKGLCISLFLGYVQFYKKDFLRLKFKQVEHEFAVNYRGIVLRGKIDGLFNHTHDPLLRMMEHKTKSQIQENVILKVLHNDFQALFYYFVLVRLLKLDMGGVSYNVIRRPSLRMKKTEELSDFIARVYDDICTRPKHYYKRYEIIYTKKDLDSFEETLDMMLDEIEMIIQGELGCYGNLSNCQFPYVCKYLDLCSTKKTDGYIIRPKLFPELKGGI